MVTWPQEMPTQRALGTDLPGYDGGKRNLICGYS